MQTQSRNTDAYLKLEHCEIPESLEEAYNKNMFCKNVMQLFAKNKEFSYLMKSFCICFLSG